VREWSFSGHVASSWGHAHFSAPSSGVCGPEAGLDRRHSASTVTDPAGLGGRMHALSSGYTRCAAASLVTGFGPLWTFSPTLFRSQRTKSQPGLKFWTGQCRKSGISVTLMSPILWGGG
jgi:hypothetical protein